MPQQMLTQVELFRETLERYVRLEHARNFPNVEVLTSIVAKIGKKYAKIIKEERSVNTGEVCHRSAHCFIDLATGDILKAASWAAPAKHPRGNIVTTIGMGVGTSVGSYGAAYLK